MRDDFYGSPEGPHSDFVFIFHFLVFIFYVSVFIFYFSVFVFNFLIFNVLIFTSSSCFSVLVFILSFSDFVFNVLIFTSSFCILWPFWASVGRTNVLIFTSSFCFSALVLVLVFILSFSDFVFNALLTMLAQVNYLILPPLIALNHKLYLFSTHLLILLLKPWKSR